MPKKRKTTDEHLKKEALKHWYDNLKRIDGMSWHSWRKLSSNERYHVMHSPPFIGPRIFGDSCPYCRVYHTGPYQCTGCPLKDLMTDDGCCPEWGAVFDALVEGKAKRVVEKRIKAMIK